MKKVILLFAAIVMLYPSGINAQVEKGKLIVGISSAINLSEFQTGSNPTIMRVGSSSIKTKSDIEGYVDDDPIKSFGFSLTPKFGYSFADNFVLGLDLVILHSSQKTTGSYESKYSSTTTCIGPFARYYIQGKKIYPFFELGTTFGSNTNKYTYQENTDKDTGSIVSFNGGFGVAVPIGDNVTFDALAGYTSTTLKENEDNDDNWRYVIGTFDIKLGFTIFL